MNCKNIYISFATIAFASLALLFSCSKYDNPGPNFEEYELPPDTVVQRKVLLISIDGAVGKEMKEIMPETIKSLIPNSKYSFRAIAGENTGDAPTWTSLMVGQTSATHHISNEDYLPEQGEDEHAELVYPTSFINRIEKLTPEKKTYAISQSTGLANVLLLDADESALAANDEDAKNKAVDYLKNRNVDIMVLQLTDVIKAGVNSSFSASSPEYVAAVKKDDQYVGEIINALKARANYKYEDWLIILTSNHGGTGNTYGGSSFQERNSFTLYHNPNFASSELNGEMITPVNFYGFDGSETNSPTEGVRARNANIGTTEDDYNPAKTKQLTIAAKIKINKNKARGDYYFDVPPFLSKTNARTGQTPGWSFFRNGNGVSFFTADGSVKNEMKVDNISRNGEWAHITGVIYQEGENVVSKFYVNGVLSGTQSNKMDITKVLSPSALTFGFQGSTFFNQYVDFYMCDVMIFNKSLEETEVRALANKMGIAESDSYYANLKGYWPMQDNDKSGKFKNAISGKPDITLQGKYSYKVSANTLPFVDANKSILFQDIDIAPQVYYWMGVKTQDTWKLEGSVFLNKFEVEFLK
ncbi:LamG-like jellyroll fold domain-containing protein [Sphingobacterium spiritivorum]|uniref:LamG-like jellyroll fold domain-containing protein n=1 Tax=Sphingobacterium spiritivorum TaxID=258 RepID=UPI003DA5EA9D